VKIIIKSPQILAILAFLNLIVVKLAFSNKEFPFKQVLQNFAIYQNRREWVWPIASWVIVAGFGILLSIILFWIKKIKLTEILINIFISISYAVLIMYYLVSVW